MTEVKEGDKFLFVPRDRRGPPEWVTVSKVGRKWIAFGPSYSPDRWRADKKTLDVDGYTSPGTLWPSEEAFEESKSLNRDWQALKQAIQRHYSCPRHVSRMDIEKAAAALGLTLNAVKD